MGHCGVVVEIDWCVGRHAICVFAFSLCFSIFLRHVFCTLSAPNRGAASKVCGNEHCFSVLRLGILMSGDGIDGM